MAMIEAAGPHWFNLCYMIAATETVEPPGLRVTMFPGREYEVLGADADPVRGRLKKESGRGGTARRSGKVAPSIDGETGAPLDGRAVKADPAR
jgi:hypothetical protein